MCNSNSSTTISTSPRRCWRTTPRQSDRHVHDDADDASKFPDDAVRSKASAMAQPCLGTGGVCQRSCESVYDSRTNHSVDARVRPGRIIRGVRLCTVAPGRLPIGAVCSGGLCVRMGINAVCHARGRGCRITGVACSTGREGLHTACRPGHGQHMPGTRARGCGQRAALQRQTVGSHGTGRATARRPAHPARAARLAPAFVGDARRSARVENDFRPAARRASSCSWTYSMHSTRRRA